MTSRATSAGQLLVAASFAVVVGLLIGLGAELLSGHGALGAALAGAGIGIGVLFFGSFLVDLVASVMPAAALLVALLTYTLQLVLLLVLLIAIDHSHVFAAPAEARALATSVIGVVLAWTVAQIMLAVRRRTPVFDLPGQSAMAGER
ncbi:MAG: hypothetical protein ACXVWW_05770 [Nocardioides sp.]